MMDVKISKDKHIVADKGKTSKTPNEVKPVKNGNKNPQISLKISPVEKEVPLQINCKIMHRSNRISWNVE